MEIIGDLLPPGVVNIVNGFGVEEGKPLASSSRVAKIAFTGETTTGRLIMQYASENIIPVTLELGGGFSLESPEGMRFLIRSRLYSNQEWLILENEVLPTGNTKAPQKLICRAFVL